MTGAVTFRWHGKGLDVVKVGWRKWITVGGLLILVWTLVVTPASAESDDPARSFVECVASGGEVRRDGDDFSCRHVVSYTMRTYLSGETECGEEIQYEIWDEIRYGTVTFAFTPHRIEKLTEVGESWDEASATPIPCLETGS